jgi:hypothetical protein
MTHSIANKKPGTSAGDDDTGLTEDVGQLLDE